MIIYDLECGNQHRFEGWFKNANEFTEQQQTGMLICPICGSEEIRKIPSASHIAKGHSETAVPKQNVVKANKQAHQALQMVHDFINKNFDDVGNNFASEAKKIHNGEVSERNIRGTATANEVKELKEEGILTVKLPPAPYDKDKLN